MRRACFVLLLLLVAFIGAPALAQERGHGHETPAEQPAGEGGEEAHAHYHPLDVRALAVQALGFAILAAVLGYFAFPFIADALGKRRQAIAEGFDEIERKVTAAERAKEEAQKKLKDAERDGPKRLEEARLEGVTLREQLVEEATEAAVKILDKARLEGKIEYAKMLIELRNEVVEAALTATEAILRETMDEKTQDDLLMIFFDDLDRLAKKTGA